MGSEMCIRDSYRIQFSTGICLAQSQKPILTPLDVTVEVTDLKKVTYLKEHALGDRYTFYEVCHRSGSKWVEVERAQRWVEMCRFGSTSGPLRAQPAATSDEVGRSELPASHVASPGK